MDGINLADGVSFSSTPRFAHIDLALKHDRAGLAVCHIEDGRVVFDLVHYFELSDFRGEAEIDLEHIRNVLLAMKQAGANFRLVSFDGFQSADSRQLLRKQGIPTEYHSVDRNTESYDVLKELVYAGQVSLPETERSRVFDHEARRLELIDGKKVDHPPRGSKDVSDAVAGAAFHAAQALSSTPEIPDVWRNIPSGDTRHEKLTNAVTGEQADVNIRTTVSEPEDVVEDDEPGGGGAAVPADVSAVYPALKRQVEEKS